jgi:hypothetical protein
MFLLDLESGARTQLTRLPSSAYVAYPVFLGEERLGFLAAGIGDALLYTVRMDGNDLYPIPPLASLPGGAVVPSFQITGVRFPTYGDFPDSTPENPGFFAGRRAAFVSDGTNTVQITNFNRSDTARYGTVLSPDREYTYFTASVDLGDNPMGMCQVFSASVLGGEIGSLPVSRRIIVALRLRATVSDGCSSGLSFGSDSTDTRNGMVVFDSGCDPFGTNPNGEQIFAIRPDGTGLQQLTQARGFIRGSGRDGFTELPGPWAYGPHP